MRYIVMLLPKMLYRECFCAPCGLNFTNRCLLGQFVNPQAQRFALIGLENLEAVPLDGHFVTGGGNLARDMTEQSGDGGYRLMGFAAKSYAQQFLHFSNIQTAPNDQSATRLADHVRGGRLSIVPTIP